MAAGGFGNAGCGRGRGRGRVEKRIIMRKEKDERHQSTTVLVVSVPTRVLVTPPGNKGSADFSHACTYIISILVRVIMCAY